MTRSQRLSPRIRPARAADVPAIIACFAAGFEGYRAFAPPGWEPPDVTADSDRIAAELDQPATFARVAEVDGAFAGHVVMVPAQAPSRDGSVPDLHFRQLFVLEPFWGGGVATALHAAAVEVMRGTVRLYTPAGQARARRFYEREGWALHDGPYEDDKLGMPIVEYRRVARR
jgi:GNAT superfamily N-acetyltransferase